MSQENVSDKVRNLQRQIAQSIKFGQKPPSLRKSEDEQGSSDENEGPQGPQSPLEVLSQVEAEPDPNVYGESLVQGFHRGEIQHTPVKSPRSKCILPATGTIESINLDSVPQSVPRLDNTAAKHKLSVKPKNQRVSRKHRKFTPDLQDMSPPPVLHEETEDRENLEGPWSRHEGSPFDSPDSFSKQTVEERLESREKRDREEEELRGEELDEERRKRAEELYEIGERCRRQQEEDHRQSMELERRTKEEEDRKAREDERTKREEEEKEERRMKEEDERTQREKEETIREEEERRRAEEQRRREEETLEAERLRVEEEGKRLREKAEQEERRKIQEDERKREEKRRRDAEEPETAAAHEGESGSDPVARRRKAEELRWREMEERQRPFSFKVSSGEKQILFQKVNLTPVTLPSSQQEGTVTTPREDSKASSPGGAESLSMSSIQYVPHTAILVTGAQLCGPAVNLDQIKDTACKSLLGLGEDKKGMNASPTKCKTSPERKSGKTKSLSESSTSSDQSSAAILAEWASIRSKIFKGADEGMYEGYPDPGHSPTQVQSGISGEDPDKTPFPHTSLRKTMSASAKFSITPAKKKFAESSRNMELSCQADKDRGPTENAQSDGSSGTTAISPAPDSKAQSKATKVVRIAGRSEGCQFAKDLPSFLVPSPDQDSTQREGPEARSPGELDESDENLEGEKMGPDDQTRPSPFGIKLRRTNYSLRFQGDQPTEKRKKRYSAGDTFDGVPPPLAPIEPDSNSSSALPDKSSSASPLRERSPVHTAAPSSVARAKRGGFGAGEKTSPKPPLYHRASTAVKFTCADAPPQLPLLKTPQGGPGEAVTQRTGLAADSADQEEQGKRRDESSAVAQLLRASQGDEEPKEKKSFFPSISIPWREKPDRKAELIKREKPSLQSRHSLDSVRTQEKDSGPLWITLALQKQKGFREQQQGRDDRRSQREAKLAEKQAKETSGSVSPSENKGNTNTSPKPQQTQEAKRPDTLLARFERRDNLKKANTLPSSVTVEISDSPPLSPAVKEVTKRLPSSDSPQASTEPAWLALAKRKAKAWSDCPQIIK
ncbi:capping protein inhibiting regulator of actin dynamics [Hypomesus transpacificus]|uniref:capping protein inhibiting regulator of actin dynamics n=1 Tax=Hypomesus transpacificus TaxID=137520 RepID=UPI001F0800E4|nr:capping protein inhibiting regulator of actin dynamics [Hypomesus transpacificus]